MLSFGFELAMQRDYQLFFFGVDLPMLAGEQLYEFIAKAYAHNRPSARTPPGVIFLTDEKTQAIPQALSRDARVKGIISCPFEISRLLSFADGALPPKGDWNMTEKRYGGAFLSQLDAAPGDHTLVKICGFTVAEEAVEACEAGADAVGINFYPKSKRFISVRGLQFLAGGIAEAG